jgi:hypothetical protein
MLSIKLSFSKLFALLPQKIRQLGLSCAAYFGLFLIVALYIHSQPLVIARYGHDVINYFDYIYRFLYGLRPGQDIWTAYGSLPFWFMGQILKVTSYSTSFIWIFILFVLLCWLPFFYKIDNVGKLKFLALVPILLGLFHLGDINAITYANFYNRVCFFIFLSIIIFCRDDNKDYFYDLYAGLGLFFLLNIKISFFGLAIIYLLLFRSKNIKNWVLFFLFFESIYFLLIDHSLFRYIEVNRAISNVYKPQLLVKLNEIIRFKQINLQYYFYAPSIAYFLGLKFKKIVRFLAGNILVLLAQQFNYLPSTEPLLALNFTYLIDSYFEEKSLPPLVKRLFLIGIIYLTYLIALPYIQSYHINQLNKKAIFQNFSSISSIQDLNIKYADGFNNLDYLAVNAEALSMLTTCSKEYKNCSSGVLIVSFEDFVTRELGLIPSRKNIIPFQFNYTFDYKTHPDPNSIFNNINYILHRLDDPEASMPFLSVYQNELNSFEVCQKKKYWQLMCRK